MIITQQKQVRKSGFDTTVDTADPASSMYVCMYVCICVHVYVYV